MLCETLLQLSDGSRLVVTVDDRAGHEYIPRDTEWLFARWLPLDGLERNVLEAIGQPIAADDSGADYMGSSARTQAALAATHQGKRDAVHYLENARNFAVQAAALRKPTIHMPCAVFALRDLRVFCVYRRPKDTCVFRIVGLEHGDEQWRSDAAALHGALFKVSTRISGQDVGVLPKQIRPLWVDDDRMLLSSGAGRALVALEHGGYRLIAHWPTMFGEYPIAAATRRGLVFHGMSRDETDLLLHVDRNDGHVIDKWPSRGKRTLAHMSGTSPPSDLIVLSALSGEVVVHKEGEAIEERLPKLLGLGKHDYATSALSADGSVVGMCKSFDAKELVLFDRVNRSFARLPYPPVSIRDVDGERQLRVPGFVIGTNAVEVVANGLVTTSAFDSLEWEAPYTPPKRALRLGRAPFCVDEAVRNGPLSRLASTIRAWRRPSVALTPKPLRRDSQPLGSSQAGGLPHLPGGAAWPRFRGTPMAFLLQVNLADIASVRVDIGFPRDGLLSVFLGLDDDYPIPAFYGDANHDPLGCRMLYTAPGTQLERLPLPEDMPHEYSECEHTLCSYSFNAGGATLPALTHSSVEHTLRDAMQREAYSELLALIDGDLEDKSHWGTRMGGYPALLQNDDIHLVAECRERRVNPTGNEIMTLWQNPEFHRRALRWRQAFQLGSGPEGWLWGDGGLMHLMVDDSKWQSLDFDAVWSVGVN
jgi:hypothetical protein